MRILLLPGSKRDGSINVRLLQAIANRIEQAGHTADRVEEADLTAPIYDSDCEAEVGVPDSIKALNQRMKDADAIVVASPEYNGYFSPLLKNTLDWMSRKQDGQPGTAVFTDKPALVLAASPGAMAAARALPHIRQQLANLGLNVYRAQLGVGKATERLDEQGNVVDDNLSEQLDSLTTGFLDFAGKLAR